MGFLGCSGEETGRGGQSSRVGFKALIRRKQVDSANSSSPSSSGHHQLAKELSVPHLISIGNPCCNSWSFFLFFNLFLFWKLCPLNP